MAKYHGQCVVDEGTGTVHHPECRWVDIIEPENRRSYASVKAAVEMGYIVHKGCLIEWYLDDVELR